MGVVYRSRLSSRKYSLRNEVSCPFDEILVTCSYAYRDRSFVSKGSSNRAYKVSHRVSLKMRFGFVEQKKAPERILSEMKPNWTEEILTSMCDALGHDCCRESPCSLRHVLVSSYAKTPENNLPTCSYILMASL